MFCTLQIYGLISSLFRMQITCDHFQATAWIRMRILYLDFGIKLVSLCELWISFISFNFVWSLSSKCLRKVLPIVLLFFHVSFSFEFIYSWLMHWLILLVWLLLSSPFLDGWQLSTWKENFQRLRTKRKKNISWESVCNDS